MANTYPFDRRTFRQRERPTSNDWNDVATQAHYSLVQVYDRLSEFQLGDGSDPSGAAYNAQTGFVGEGFRVMVASASTVLLKAGVGFLLDGADQPVNIGSGDAVPMLGVSDQQRVHPLYLSADETINVPAADPANPRIDIIEVKVARRQLDPQNRAILDPGTGIFGTSLVNKMLRYDAAGTSTLNGSGYINYKSGTAAAVPVAPGVTAGYIKIAEVYVEAPVLALTNASAVTPFNCVTDLRVPWFPAGALPFAARFRVSATTGAVPDLISHSLPPGWKLAVQCPAAPTASFNVVLVGPQTTDFTLAASATYEGAETVIATVATAGPPAALSAFSRNLIATAATVVPNLFVGNDQPGWVMAVKLARWDGAAAAFVDVFDTASGFDNPHYVNVVGNIYRIAATT
jgi:hypothetical protein